MDFKKFFAELQRRNVYKVAIAYSVASWLLIQIATQTFPVFDIPNWATRMVVFLLLLGFPVALVLAWAYELTPEGLQRTGEVDPKESIARSTGRKLDFMIIGVLLAVIAFMGFQHFRPAKSAPNAGIPQKSIVILPFLDLSPTKDQEYFSDGITEQIINSLARLRGLLVVARTTAFSFKNKNMDVREVGQRLQVNHVLEGSVSRSMGRVRVVVQLIDVANGFHLWSETYDSTEQDVLSLQSDVARKVASALQVELHLAEAKQIAKPPTLNAEAYDLYLRGRYFLNKRTVDSLKKARALFEQALTKDSRFALGHAGLADAYILLGQYGAMSADEAAAHAWPEAAAAIAIDDHLAAGYISRAMLLTDFDWNWPAAEIDYQKALDLDPNNGAARHWYAFYLAQNGRPDEALKIIETAEKSDPLSPIIRAAKARIFWTARRYDQAIEQCHSALELEPNFQPALAILARSLTARERYPEALEAAKKYGDLAGNDLGNFEIAYIYAVARSKGGAGELLPEANAPMAQLSPCASAPICAALHDADGTMRWLEAAIVENSLAVAWIRVDPRMDTVRSDPRFEKILARMTPRQRNPQN